MVLGLDYSGVLDKRIVSFVELAEAVIYSGEVYIVTAVKTGNEEAVRRAIDRTSVPYTEVIVVEYDNYGDVPRLKFQACSEKGIQLFIDDRQDTVNYLNKRGITALLYKTK